MTKSSETPREGQRRPAPAVLARRDLGRTGLRISALGYGTMELRGAEHHKSRPLSPGRAEEVLESILNCGIDFIDTSIDYGESEAHIGRVLGDRRSQYILATKCGCPVGRTTAELQDRSNRRHQYDREHIRRGLAQSLERLRTDYVDLLQVHMSPSRAVLEQEQTVETLHELRAEGSVRYIGISSTLPNIEDHLAMGVFDVIQVPYSALQREHEEVIGRLTAAGLGVIIRGAVAQGPGSDRFAKLEAAGMSNLLDGMSQTEFLLRFALTLPINGPVLIGTSDTKHLRANVEAAQRGPLPDDIYEEARKRLAVE